VTAIAPEAAGRFDWVRLTLRLHRFELFTFGVAIIGLAVAAFGAAAYVEGFRLPPECVNTTSEVLERCDAAYRSLSDAQFIAGLVLSPLLIVTFAIGLFLGVPVIARELERGTVRLAWWLTPSRWRWYLARLLPILVLVTGLVFIAGVAIDRLFAANNPGVDMSRSFEGFGARGGLLAARALFVFAASVAVGSLLGRVLPAVIVAALVVTIGLTAVTNVHDRILQGEVAAIPVDPTGSDSGYRPGDRVYDQKFVLPDGTYVGYEYFFDGGGANGDAFDENGNPKYPMVSLVIPGERYRSVEAREAAILLVGSLAALVIAGFVVVRRRPG
jgi:ABC-type transport system involved in multi-copper enzyme maturation permease subunit